MYGFKRPQALVEIDQAVGLDGAGNCVGPLLVVVELVIVMGRSKRSARQLGPLRSMGLMRSPKNLQLFQSTRSTRHLGPL